MEIPSCDVVIVGGGLAGTRSALLLVKFGFSVLLLVAKNVGMLLKHPKFRIFFLQRLGGRIETVLYRSSGSGSTWNFDLGAQVGLRLFEIVANVLNHCYQREQWVAPEKLQPGM